MPKFYRPVNVDKSIIFPVGSVYLTVSDDNPSIYFGGTWEKMSGGYVYGAMNSCGNGNGTGTNTGQHSLSTAQIPSHTHSFSATTSSAGAHRHNTQGQWRVTVATSGSSRCLSYDYISGDPLRTDNPIRSAGAHTHTVSGTSGSTGSGSGHAHIIPYIAVWVWKRVG